MKQRAQGFTLVCLLISALTGCLATTATAQYFTFGDYSYTATNGAVAVAAYTGPGGDVTVPRVIAGLPVTAIGDKAFDQCSSLTRVTIPDGITGIGDHAFRACVNLKNVKLPDSGVFISPTAFEGCPPLAFGNGDATPLKGAPGSVAQKREDPFAHLRNRVDSEASREGYTYTVEYGRALITGYNREKVAGDFVITNRLGGCPVVSIGSLSHCKGLTSITVPAGVARVDSGAFMSCTSLTNVTIPDSVTYIGSAAFSGCDGLTAITIGKSVTIIDERAFSRSRNLKGVYFKGNAPDLCLDAFEGADQATVYYLPGTEDWDTEFGGRPTAVWNLSGPSGAGGEKVK